jgi:hypothetical protein
MRHHILGLKVQRQYTKPDVVVSVVWRVPVAIGGTAVLWFVVPRATAQHAVLLQLSPILHINLCIDVAIITNPY